MTTPSRTACPVCQTESPAAFLTLEGVPVQDGRLWADVPEALAAPTGTVDLRFCESCGHVWNSRFDGSLIRFDPAYDISLHHSPVYHAFVQSVVARLVERYSLHGKRILEVGCGKGDYLIELCRAGKNAGVGYDPTYVPRPDVPPGTAFVTRFFSEQDAQDLQIDFGTARSVLQYFGEPGKFIGNIRRALRTDEPAAVYFEVPNGHDTFSNRIVWNLAYEHANLYSEPSLTQLLTLAGFDVAHVGKCFGEQNLGIEGVLRPGGAAKPADTTAAVARHRADVMGFAEDFRTHVDGWRQRVAGWQKAGKKIAIWGAGARAVGFLSLLQLKQGETDIAVVDINPKRQGLFMPLTCQQVTSPQSLHQRDPDVVIASNPTFAPEIRKQFDAMKLRAEFLVL